MKKTIFKIFGTARLSRHLFIDTILLGVVGALSAQLFMLLLRIATHYFLGDIAGYTPPSLPVEGGTLVQVIGQHGLWLIPLVTTLGGLISGILVYSIAPEAEGHGTDTAVKAFHRTGGFIRARVAPLKMVASAITIGSGGSAGREGPTALFSAGIGSIYATLLHRSDQERRLLALIGMASGLSAIFRSPIGTAFFAVEVLYGGMEFESGALLYTMIGSIIAYTVNGLFVGFDPLFTVPSTLTAPTFFSYFFYTLLGIAAGLVATLLPVVFYGIRDLFKAIPIPNHVKPAIGGFFVGIIGLVLPQAIGGGYGWIQEAINGQLAVNLLLFLVFAKLLTFSLSISSGGSGGIFGPSLFVGAMLGALLGKVFHEPSAAFAIVGMAAVFGGAARVPIATMIMVTEMTGGYSLLVPAALAVMVSYIIQVAVSRPFKYQSLYEAQVRAITDSPVHRNDQFEKVLTLLNNHKIEKPSTRIHLKLESLLMSGIHVDLGRDRQFSLVPVLSDGKLTEDHVRRFYHEDDHELEVVAVIRGDDILEPEGEFDLLKGDRMVVITPPKEKNKLLDPNAKEYM